MCGRSAPVPVKAWCFGTHLPSHSLLLSWLLKPGSLSDLRGRKVEADSTLQGFYSGLVLQVSHQSQSHPPVEQPSVATPKACVVEGYLIPPPCPPDVL